MATRSLDISVWEIQRQGTEFTITSTIQGLNGTPTWYIFDSETLSQVATSNDTNPAFTINTVGAYDVALFVNGIGRLWRRKITVLEPLFTEAEADHVYTLDSNNNDIYGDSWQAGDKIFFKTSSTVTGRLTIYNANCDGGARAHILLDPAKTVLSNAWPGVNSIRFYSDNRNLLLDFCGNSSDYYGWKIHDNGVTTSHAVSIGQGGAIQRNTKIEICGIHIQQADTYGASGIRYLADESATQNRNNFQIEDIKIHHIWAQNCGHEGIYLGYTDDSDGGNGGPSQFYGTRVYRCIFENTGRDGIQPCNQVSDLEIHDCEVINPCQLGESVHYDYISWNTGNSGRIYNIKGKGGRKAMSIQFGNTGSDAYFYNISLECGTIATGTSQIFCKTESGADCNLHWFNNTIIGDATSDKRFFYFLKNATQNINIFNFFNNAGTGNPQAIYTEGSPVKTNWIEQNNNIVDNSALASLGLDAANYYDLADDQSACKDGGINPLSIISASDLKCNYSIGDLFYDIDGYIYPVFDGSSNVYSIGAFGGLEVYDVPTGSGPITYDAELLALWRSRWTNGYNPIPNRPDGKAESIARSVFYHANPGTDYVTTDVRTTDPAHGKYVVSAAFQYLMDGTGGATVHDHLLAQVQEVGCDYGSFPDSDLGTIGNATVRFSSTWVMNMFLVYDYTYDLYTAGERAIIDAWFYDAAVFFQRSLSQGVFETQFPNRNADDNYLTNAALVADQAAHTTGRFYYSKETNLNYELTGSKTGSINDYTERAYAQRDYTATAGSTASGSMSTRYTHRDNLNVLQNQISDSGAFWSNQQAMMARVVALGGKYFNNAMMQDHSKLWAEESLKYGTYPDGTMTEYRRNETATPMLGSSFYGMIIVEGLIMVADLYPDDSVWEYYTSVGIHGTAGGTKNIRLLIERVMQICTTVYDDADSIYFYEGKSEANLIDTQRTATYRYLPEVPLSWANRYYQEDAIQEVYLLTAANSNPYSATGEYPFGTLVEWGGANANFPEFVYMFHETEYLYATEQAPTASAGIDKAITLPTNSVVIYGTAIPGTGNIVSTVWTQISGPNTAGLSGDTTTTLTASSLIEGTYVFRLTVTDDTPLVDFDEVNVVVYPTPVIPENAFGTLHLFNI